MKHLPKIEIEVISHKAQRYNTLGDYLKEDGAWKIKVSKMSADLEFMVAMHEIIEWYLTQRNGIPEPTITEFDKMFEMERDSGIWDDEEPGEDKRAPYRKEHMFAEKIERLICQELKIKWSDYNKTVNNL